jgi:hypothetical protein
MKNRQARGENEHQWKEQWNNKFHSYYDIKVRFEEVLSLAVTSSGGNPINKILSLKKSILV